jgi:hypothetical protein
MTSRIAFSVFGTATSSGLAAVTFNHRSTYDVPAREVEADLVELLATLGRDRTYLRIDVDRLALFAISAGVPLALVSALNGTCAEVRSVVAHYGPPDLRPYGQIASSRSSRRFSISKVPSAASLS